ncbi:MAG: rhomboid family intramembrane serine protease [Thermoleophilaceae bacterium]
MFPLKDNIPTRRFPILTVLIIVACTVVYFGFEHGGIGLGGKGNERVVQYGATPYEITHPGKHCFIPPADSQAARIARAARSQVLCEGQKLSVLGASARVPDNVPSRLTKGDPSWWVTAFTAMFMHGGLLHLAGNMLFLWIFGNNIEDSMGRPRFVLFYLLGGLAALAAQVAVGPNAAVPTVGASGAIAAVLGGYALLYPRARVVTVIFIILFFTILELPALVVLGLWFVIQLLYGASDLAQPVGTSGGVAYFAHIGGFVFGLLLIKLFANRMRDDAGELQRRIPVY